MPQMSEVQVQASPWTSLVDHTTPFATLDVLHHQHAEGGSGHSGTVTGNACLIYFLSYLPTHPTSR